MILQGASMQNDMSKTTNKHKDKSMVTQEAQQKVFVEKRILSNGMTILVRVARNIPKVSIQLWYQVGSKDEKTGERGIAHLIEHMIFKGTETLSESDINILTHRLSGNTNAFTSYDYTGYLFNFPTQHWQEAFPVMADTMQHVSFKDDHLNSEMKAVIQELKMNRDNYTRSAVMELMSAIFPDHPYHYPVIGYKQDLWSVHADDLRVFYKKHYWPNNATLVVVGDVDPEEVFTRAQESFGKIVSNPDYKKENFYFNQDIIAKSITLYRDVKHPIAMTMFVVPGIKSKKSQLLDVLSLALGTGKASRLHRILVDELQIATSITTDYWSLFDYSLFFFVYEPKATQDIQTIEKVIVRELEDIAKTGFQEKELVRAVKKAKMNYFTMLESTQQQAQEIGLYYLATGDENFSFNYLNQPLQEISVGVHEIMQAYFRPAIMHKAYVLPLPEEEKSVWQKLQHASDQEDLGILAARERSSEVEPPSYALKISVKQPEPFSYPKSHSFTTSNKIKVLQYNNTTTPKIDLVFELKAKGYYDPQEKQGLYNFVARMVTEGTKHYTTVQLAHEIESRGMSLRVYPGGITMSMLSSDFEKGLEILHEVLTNALFNDIEIEKVRQQIFTDIKLFWDDSRSIAGQLIREVVYKNHPYNKNQLGTNDSIASLSRKDLVDFYNHYFSPDGAKLAIVGDIKQYNVQKIVEKYLGSWQRVPVEDMVFPSLTSVKPEEITYPLNRDQILLAFAGLSIERTHKDFDKLLLFDQIFGGGVLGSMSSRLFDLREQSGLFYSISGSTVARANEQPGLVLVQTLISKDRLKEAENIIKKTMDEVVDTIQENELIEARNALINAAVNNFESNMSIAQTFLFLDKYNFSPDYFDMRAKQLSAITREDVLKAVKHVLRTKNMLTLKIGRLSA